MHAQGFAEGRKQQRRIQASTRFIDCTSVIPRLPPGTRIDSGRCLEEATKYVAFKKLLHLHSPCPPLQPSNSPFLTLEERPGIFVCGMGSIFSEMTAEHYCPG